MISSDFCYNKPVTRPTATDVNSADTITWIVRIVIFSRNRAPRYAPVNADALAVVTMVQLIESLCVEISAPYISKRDTSTMTASTTPVATKRSFSSPALSRNMLRKAPWCPDKPPKKPLTRPPKGSHLLSKAIFEKAGVISKTTKRMMRKPIASFRADTWSCRPRA